MAENPICTYLSGLATPGAACRLLQDARRTNFCIAHSLISTYCRAIKLAVQVQTRSIFAQCARSFLKPTILLYRLTTVTYGSKTSTIVNHLASKNVRKQEHHPPVPYIAAIGNTMFRTLHAI